MSVFDFPFLKYTANCVLTFIPIDSMRHKLSLHVYQGPSFMSKLMTRIQLRLFPKLVNIANFSMIILDLLKNANILLIAKPLTPTLPQFHK